MDVRRGCIAALAGLPLVLLTACPKPTQIDPSVVEQLLLGAFQCWLGDEEKHFSDVDLVVRTVNLKGNGLPDYPKRLKGIAEDFYSDWPMNIGVIGMQEAKVWMTHCPVAPARDFSAPCFARLLEKEYGNTNAEGTHGYYFKTLWGASLPTNTSLGAVVGAPWQIVGQAFWEIGQDANSHLGNKSIRYLLETILMNDAERWTLRFYTTQISHPPGQEAQRHAQIGKIIDIVRSRVGYRELPPVIVGDFNMSKAGEPSSFDMMNAHFSYVLTQAIGCLPDGKPMAESINNRGDQIWTGRPSSFPQTRGLLIPIQYHTGPTGGGILLATRHVVDGTVLDSLTDHNSPGITFKIDTTRAATRPHAGP